MNPVTKVNNFNSFDENIILKIFNYLSASDKRIVASVCQLWKKIAQDPALLFIDFASGQKLSLRQILSFINQPGIPP